MFLFSLKRDSRRKDEGFLLRLKFNLSPSHFVILGGDSPLYSIFFFFKSVKWNHTHLNWLEVKNCCCCSVAKSCLTLPDTMDRSMPRLPCPSVDGHLGCFPVPHK